MTAGAFLTCGPMVEGFGLHEIKNKAEAVRRVWPDAIPKGKEQIGVYEAAYLIYVFASTDKIKDIHDRVIAKRIWSCAHATNNNFAEGSTTASFIGDLIAGKGAGISHLEISIKTGVVRVFRRNGLIFSFVPEPTRDVPTYNVEEVTIIKDEFFKKLGSLFLEEGDGFSSPY